MKKYIPLLLIIFIINSTNIFAQNKRGEINIGFGILTTSEFIDAFSDVLSSATSLGYINSNESYSGSVFFNYKYAISNRLSAGATVAYESSDADIRVGDNQKAGDISNYYYTIAGELSYKYLKSKYISLYALGGIGVTLHKQKLSDIDDPNNLSAIAAMDKTDNVTHFNFQVTPLGIRIGNGFGGFLEGGFGYKGILSGGLFARF